MKYAWEGKDKHTKLKWMIWREETTWKTKSWMGELWNGSYRLGVEWMHLAHERDKRRALENLVMNFQVPYKTGDFLTSWGTISFLPRTPFHRGS